MYLHFSVALVGVWSLPLSCAQQDMLCSYDTESCVTSMPMQWIYCAPPAFFEEIVS